jgi:cytochrome b involved in lipid metabolism
MKKKWVLLFVGILFASALVYYFLSNEKNQEGKELVLGNSTVENSISSEFTLEKISLHSVKADCWVVYKNKVYDLSGFLTSGGHKDVSYLCGTDMTEEYDNKIGDGKHTESKLTKFFIGELK